MNKKFQFALLLLAAVLIAMSGCSQPPGDGTQQGAGTAGGETASGTPSGGQQQGGPNPAETAVPAECAGLKGGVCDVFECMVKQCRCDKGKVPSAVLSEGKGAISSEQGAIDAVKGYLDGADSEYTDVRRAVKLNSFFWNVFAYNSAGNEETFTIAMDGTIIKTVCGV